MERTTETGVPTARAAAGVPASGPGPRPYPLPADEAERLRALARYGDCGTPSEETLDRLARAAAAALDTPLAFVSLVDDDDQHFKACVGHDVATMPRELAFCAHTLCHEGPFVIEDATRDERFARNPFVTGEPEIRAYAGFPLQTEDGHAIGVLCVLDTEPRVFTEGDLTVLSALAASAMEAFEAKRRGKEHRALFEEHPQAMFVYADESHRLLDVNAAALATYGYGRDEMLALTIRELRPEDEVPAYLQDLEHLNGHVTSTGPRIHRRKDGSTFYARVETSPTTLGGQKARLVRVTDVTEEVGSEEATRAFYGAVLDQSRAEIAVLDAEGHYVYVSPSAVEDPAVRAWLIGRTDFDYCRERGHDESLARARDEHRQRAIESRAPVEWEEHIVRSDGSEYHYIRILSPLVDEEGRVTHLVGHSHDVTERQAVAARLRERDRLLSGMAEGLHALLTEDGLERAVGLALRALGEGADVDRVYLFENHTDPESGALLASQRAEWVSDGIESEIDNPDLQGLHFGSIFPEWAETLGRGEPVWGHVRELSEQARTLLEEENIVSLLLVPVMVDGTCWGFVGFDDCWREREWSPTERATLEAAAVALGAAYARSRAESALRVSEARYRSLTEATTAIVWAFPPSGEVAAELPEWEAFTGQTFSEYRGLGWREMVHPDDRRATAAAWKRALEEGTPYVHEHRLRRADGEYRHMAVRAVPVLREDGTVYEWVGVHTDVHEQRLTAEALRVSETRHRGLLEAVPDTFFRLSREGRYLDVKAPDTALAVRDVSGLLGRTIAEAVPDAVACLEAIGAALDTGHLQKLEYELEVRDGERRHYEARIVPVGTDEVQAIVRDVTERKQYETRLVEAKEHAEAAARAAAEAARMKSTLLSNMSHEIRTPLTSVIGFADVLAEEVPVEHREFAQFIAQGGRRLMDTINSVLDLAQLEAGRRDLRLTGLDLGEAACKTADLLRPRAAVRGLALRCRTPEQDVIVAADAAALDRVVANLIGNAVKFTEAGSVTVSVRAVEGAGGEDLSGNPSGRVGELRVEDTGVGIADEFLPELFGEFRQESEGLARQFEGNGLGLAITKKLVEIMDGTIAVESQKGVGSTFIVRLPLAAPSASVE